MVGMGYEDSTPTLPIFHQSSFMFTYFKFLASKLRFYLSSQSKKEVWEPHRI